MTSLRFGFAVAALTAFSMLVPAGAPSQTSFANMSDEQVKSLCNDRNNAAACNAFGSAYIKNGDALQIVAAMNALQHGCDDLNNAMSCYTIGVADMGLDRIGEQTEDADRNLSKSCRLGLRAGCTKYAEFQRIKVKNAAIAGAPNTNRNTGESAAECWRRMGRSGQNYCGL